MIGSLRGILEGRLNGSLTIDVGGIGFLVHTSSNTLASLGGSGDTVRLFTQMLVRQDGIELYGFATEKELELFQLLITVNGVGPKAALGLLSSLNPERLSEAIAAGEVDLLTRVPGIGKKTAQRVILELRGKLPTPPAVALTATSADEREILKALVGLGYTVTEASEALAALPREPGLDLEEKLRMALAYFSSR